VKFRRAQPVPWTRGLAFALLAACGSSSASEDPRPAKAQSELRCEAGAARACPCLGGGQGTQTCAASGRAFGPCTACPSGAGISGGSGSQGVAGSGASGVSGAMSAGAGGRGGSGSAGRGGAGGGGVAAGSGPAIDAGAGSESREPGSPGPLPAARGIACGIGLPALCDVASEKCCKRSLSVDTCIPVATACECEEDDCEILEARCDGPEDCAQGELCCAGGTSRTAYTGFSCAASCSSTSRQACHADGDCPAQLTCAISQILASVSVCTDPRSLEQ
jgi:hypothetical protein